MKTSRVYRKTVGGAGDETMSCNGRPFKSCTQIPSCVWYGTYCGYAGQGDTGQGRHQNYTQSGGSNSPLKDYPCPPGKFRCRVRYHVGGPGTMEQEGDGSMGWGCCDKRRKMSSFRRGGRVRRGRR